jgi:hypothetical protein
MEPDDRKRYVEHRGGQQVWKFIGDRNYASKLLVAMQVIWYEAAPSTGKSHRSINPSSGAARSPYVHCTART